MRRRGRDQAVGFGLRQPSVTFVLPGQQTDLRNHLDPLPLVTRNAQQVANGREVAVHGRRLVAALQLLPSDVPDHVARDLAQIQRAQVGVEPATDPPYVRDATKMLLLARYRRTASCQERCGLIPKFASRKT